MGLWERTHGQQGYPPIPAEVDADRLMIRIGQRLGVPAPMVCTLPERWITMAKIDLEAEAMSQRQQARKRQRAQEKQAEQTTTTR